MNIQNSNFVNQPHFLFEICNVKNILHCIVGLRNIRAESISSTVATTLVNQFPIKSLGMAPKILDIRPKSPGKSLKSPKKFCTHPGDKMLLSSMELLSDRSLQHIAHVSSTIIYIDSRLNALIFCSSCLWRSHNVKLMFNSLLSSCSLLDSDDALIFRNKNKKKDNIIIPRETEGYGAELVRPSVCPSVCLSVRPSVLLDIG